MLHVVITIAWLSATSMASMVLHLMIMMSRSRVIPQKGVRRSLLTGMGRPACRRQNGHFCIFSLCCGATASLHNTNFLEGKKRQDGRMLRPSCRFFPSKRRASSSQFLCNRRNFLYFGVGFLVVAAFLLGKGMRLWLFAEAGSQDVDKGLNDDLA